MIRSKIGWRGTVRGGGKRRGGGGGEVTRDIKRATFTMASHATCLTSVSKYCGRMASGGVWGGGIEMAALSHSRRVNVHVYQVGVTLQRLRVMRWLHLTRHDVPYQFLTIPDIAFALPPPPPSTPPFRRALADSNGFPASMWTAPTKP